MGVGNEALQVEQTYFPLEFVDDPDDDDDPEQDLELMEDELLPILDDPDLKAF